MATEVDAEKATVLKLMLDAASKGNTSALCELIDKGADVNATDEEGWSPLILSSKEGHLESVGELLKRGATANPSAVAHTALRAAALYGRDEVIRTLLAAQGDPNFPSLHGRTPLMGAAMNGHPGAAAILLSAGARHDAVNDVGESALDLCKVKGNSEVAKVIVNGAARQALKDGKWGDAEARLKMSESVVDVINIEFEGGTLLDAAVAAGNEEAVAGVIALGGTKGGGNTSDARCAAVSMPRLPADPPPPSDGQPRPGERGGAASNAPEPPLASAGRRALVVGGTQFMGRLTVEALDAAGWEVVIVTRGRSKNPHPPRVRHIACNRNTEREAFRAIVEREGPWAVVVDFVAFHRAAVMDAALGLAGSGAHYILISTDSVYMACQPPPREALGGSGLREHHALRAEAPRDKEALREQDPYQYEYGGNKLECEESLEALRRRNGFRYTALRLCDVMGPYDNLGVFLRTQALLTKRLPVPAGPRGGAGGASGRMSLVFARDVAAGVLAAIDAGERVYGESINLAGAEAPTLKEFVGAVAAAVGEGPALYDDEKPAMMPSVTCGPVCTDKAKRLLAWSPTPLEEWVRETVLWYRDGKNAAYTASYALMPSS